MHLLNVYYSDTGPDLKNIPNVCYKGDITNMIHKNIKNRRYMTYKKAKRKERIVHELGDYWYYKYFGQYRKGKIHCSCSRCAAKTNDKINKSNGPISTRSCRLASTNNRHNKNYKISDLRKIIDMSENYDELD